MRTTARHLLRLAQRNAIALTALFVALAGSSYAAVTINGSQIQNRTINPSKLNPHLIAGNVRAWAIVQSQRPSDRWSRPPEGHARRRLSR